MLLINHHDWWLTEQNMLVKVCSDCEVIVRAPALDFRLKGCCFSLPLWFVLSSDAHAGCTNVASFNDASTLVALGQTCMYDDVIDQESFSGQ